MSGASAASRNGGEKDHRTYYEVHRDCEPGKKGVERAPVVEEYGEFDRARLAALGYALDGPTSTGERFTGTVTVHRVVALGQRKLQTELVDCIDERLAFRLLNELVLPHASQLMVSMGKLQEETNQLARLGY